MPGWSSDVGTGFGGPTGPPGPGPYGTGGTFGQVASGFTTSTGGTGTWLMVGLGATFTPQLTGKILAYVEAGVLCQGLGNGAGVMYGLFYGPVGANAPPANYGPLTGTVLGSTQAFKYAAIPSATTDAGNVVSFLRLLAGLTPGVTYWFDLAATNFIPAARVNFTSPNVVLTELP